VRGLSRAAAVMESGGIKMHKAAGLGDSENCAARPAFELKAISSSNVFFRDGRPLKGNPHLRRPDVLRLFLHEHLLLNRITLKM
jgi:hypothetical protein